MRILIFVLLLACVAAGIMFGALNAGVVPFDLGFVRIDVPKGAALLTALAIGWLLGGVTAWWGVRLRQFRDRRARAHPARKDATDA